MPARPNQVGIRASSCDPLLDRLGFTSLEQILMPHTCLCSRGRSSERPDQCLRTASSGQICERHAHRPVRCFKSATVQQHDAVRLGQPEGEIERVDILLQVFDRFIANVLARPELEIDRGRNRRRSSGSGEARGPCCRSSPWRADGRSPCKPSGNPSSYPSVRRARTSSSSPAAAAKARRCG